MTTGQQQSGQFGLLRKMLAPDVGDDSGRDKLVFEIDHTARHKVLSIAIVRGRSAGGTANGKNNRKAAPTDLLCALNSVASRCVWLSLTMRDMP
jgi:hypothetical protein